MTDGPHPYAEAKAKWAEFYDGLTEDERRDVRYVRRQLAASLKKSKRFVEVDEFVDLTIALWESSSSPQA